MTIAGKEKTLAELKSAAQDSREVFIATDPDREGEAIALARRRADQARSAAPPRPGACCSTRSRRTPCSAAIASAGDIDERKVEAQQARRVLDRLVGYKASPILWKTVKKGLSAGRVQTVALRLIVEREREIRAFKPVEYWTIEARLEKDGQRFTAKLHHDRRQEGGDRDEAQTRAIVAEVERSLRATAQAAERDASARSRSPKSSGASAARIRRRRSPRARCSRKRRRSSASAPSARCASRRICTRASTLAPRARSVSSPTCVPTRTRVAESAALQARDYLRALFGAEYLADGPQLYGGGKKRQNTQDAHESVRPTDPARRPDDVKRYPQGRPVQALPAHLAALHGVADGAGRVRHDHGRLRPRAGERPARRRTRTCSASTGSIIKFQGFLALYREAREEGKRRRSRTSRRCPSLEKGERVPVREITPSQHFTEPPPRFSEASLVKELERLGIGRPSTYARSSRRSWTGATSNLEQRRFFPTELGESVERVMVKQFPDIFNVGFTSEHGGGARQDRGRASSAGSACSRTSTGRSRRRSTTCRSSALIAEAHDLSALATERCPDCGGKLVPKGGFFGPFVACENHPKNCKYTRPIKGERKPAELTEYKCHECGAPMVMRHGRGRRLPRLQSRFPKCRGTRSMPTGVMCPKDGGEIAERRSKKRGKAFYGCSNYPNCDFVVLGQAGGREVPGVRLRGRRDEVRTRRAASSGSASSAATSGTSRARSPRKPWRYNLFDRPISDGRTLLTSHESHRRH